MAIDIGKVVIFQFASFDDQKVPNLVMTFTVCHGFSMALIEIDGLPMNSMVILHGKLLN